MNTRRITRFLCALTWVVTASGEIRAQCGNIINSRFEHRLVGQDGCTLSFESVIGSTQCGGDYTFTWDFGDGTSSPEPTEVHSYSQSGTYRVRLTVAEKPPCKGSSTETKMIQVQCGSPSALWLELDGPSRAAECQTTFFNATVTGGTPPYKFEWNMSEYYCPAASSANPSPFCPCPEPSNPVIINNTSPTIEARFLRTGPVPANIRLKVTDARGKMATVTHQILVKEGIKPLGIHLQTIRDCPDAYKINTQIIMLPDIRPLSAFEYPTDYFWDFGDGTTYDNKLDDGGQAYHKYTKCGVYTIKLTVSDPFGSMQAVRQVTIRDADCRCNGSGEGPPPIGDWVISNNTASPTLRLGYPGSGLPSFATISMLQNGNSCSSAANYYRWRWEFSSLAPEGQTAEVLNTMPPNPAGDILFNRCLSPGTGGALPVDEYTNNISIDLSEPGCGLLTNNQKYWGCIQVAGSVYTADPGSNPVCKSAASSCPVYIEPDKIEIEVVDEGSCRDYYLTANVTGGGWKLVDGKYIYQEYIWKAYADNPQIDPEKDPETYSEVDISYILEDVPGRPDRKKIKIDDPYFKQFNADQSFQFKVELVVNDFANHSVEYNGYISIDPFRHYLKSAYTRCPGVESKFNEQVLAAGMSRDPNDNRSAYKFIWSNGLSGPDPTFTAPVVSGASQTYHLTVSDGNCVLTASTVVTAKGLSSDFLPVSTQGCAGGGAKKIGPSDPGNLGGSGEYTFEWTPATYLSDPALSNPEVLDIAQTTTYTLKVSDVYGGCSSTDQIQLVSVPNQLQVAINGPSEVCHREEIFLHAHVPFFNTPGSIFGWTSNHKQFKPFVANEDQDDVKIDQVVSSFPGTYTFTVRYSDPKTGCFRIANKQVTIREPWKVTGYEPKTHIYVAGSPPVPLWDSGRYPNSITKPNGIVLPLSHTWLPQSPTTVVNSTGGYPIAGTFVPTPEDPYLRLIMTDNSGCIREFKTNRYVIANIKPQLSIRAAPSSVACQRMDIEFEVTFDVQVSAENRNLSWLPATCEFEYIIHDGIPSNVPHQAGKIILALDNADGLYKGKIKWNNAQAPTTGLNTPLLLTVEAKTGGVTHSFFGATFENYHFQVTSNAYWDVASYAACIAKPSSTPVTCTLGVLPCSFGTVMDQRWNVIAKRSIEIKPDGGITLTTLTAAGYDGPHLFINPCLVPKPSQEENTDSLVITDLLTTRVEERSVAQPKDTTTFNIQPAIDLSLYPNPFTGEIIIEYALKSPADTKATLRILDVAGKPVSLLFKDRQHESGKYKTVFGGEYLPAGIYWFELTTPNGLKSIKKAAKTSL